MTNEEIKKEYFSKQIHILGEPKLGFGTYSMQDIDTLMEKSRNEAIKEYNAPKNTDKVIEALNRALEFIKPCLNDRVLRKSAPDVLDKLTEAKYIMQQGIIISEK